jgi:hypothetical protein
VLSCPFACSGALSVLARFMISPWVGIVVLRKKQETIRLCLKTTGCLDRGKKKTAPRVEAVFGDQRTVLSRPFACPGALSVLARFMSSPWVGIVTLREKQKQSGAHAMSKTAICLDGIKKTAPRVEAVFIDQRSWN